MDTGDEGVLVSVSEPEARAVLVSFSPGVRRESVLVSNPVVSKEECIDVEKVVSPRVDAVPTGYEGLDDLEKTGTEELRSCPELLEPAVVTVVYMEGKTLAEPMENSEVKSISALVLLRVGGKVAAGSEIVPNGSVVFTRPGV